MSHTARTTRERCVKCRAGNDSDRTWHRTRRLPGGKAAPLLCPTCAKALSDATAAFIERWLNGRK